MRASVVLAPRGEPASLVASREALPGETCVHCMITGGHLIALFAPAGSLEEALAMTLPACILLDATDPPPPGTELSLTYTRTDDEPASWRMRSTLRPPAPPSPVHQPSPSPPPRPTKPKRRRASKPTASPKPKPGK